ncbi:DUF4256 domain-containing protein [bacterium]|nr:DUF4256 domain-containing protein [bacterium]
MAVKVQEKNITPEQKKEILSILKNRFEKNSSRHKEISWAEVQNKLEANPDKLWSLCEMEKTGGEPDLIGIGAKTGELIFADCSAESPAGRRSLSYDREGQMSRKEAIPEGNAIEMASAMGTEMMTEEQYSDLQMIGSFDRKTSSWLKTPEEVRSNGGAIFGDRRYGRVFVYHNGAQSYYSARGFRCILKI